MYMLQNVLVGNQKLNFVILNNAILLLPHVQISLQTLLPINK